MKTKLFVCFFIGFIAVTLNTTYCWPGAFAKPKVIDIIGKSGTISGPFVVDSLNSTKGIVGTGIQGKSFTINNASANSVNLNIYGNNDKTDDVNHVNFYRSIGTFAAPGAIRAYGSLGSSADDLYNFRCWGYDGAGYALGSEMAVVPKEDWSVGKHGCDFQLYLTPSGSATMQECLRVTTDGIFPGNGNFLSYTAGKGFQLYSAVTSATASRCSFFKARGDYGTPTVILNNDPLGQFDFLGHDGTDYVVSAQIIAGASENWSETARGSFYNFYTTPNTTTTPTITQILYGDNIYMAKPVGIGMLSPKVAMLTIGHDASRNYGLRITDTKSGRGGTLDTWDISTGIWAQGQLTFYNLSTGIQMNISSAGNVAIGNSVTQGSEKLNVNGAIAIKDSMTAPTATAGFAKIFVDSADGDLKVIFANGTVKTITTDTP
ncbi:MAG: hypothetical protein EHM12_11155 [Dehalococcoidia bacterium]|nr:MAG: hypothetical protein EHM12_11155 [Dehalococcoidia bacterium]